jgi:antitoxin ParD1/3/4
MATMNVSLPDPMREWVEEQVRSGDYANVSDYVRDLIRHDRERQDALVKALIEGEESGISSRSVKEILADTKANLRNGEI